jgi:hypothetical protein
LASSVFLAAAMALVRAVVALGFSTASFFKRASQYTDRSSRTSAHLLVAGAGAELDGAGRAPGKEEVAVVDALLDGGRDELVGLGVAADMFATGVGA